MLRGHMKYEMEKKGMNSMKKRSLKKPNKKMKQMPDKGQMVPMDQKMTKMKRMNKGGRCYK
jgi:hypothetical protein